jgi:hypothetical protein
MSPMCKIWAPCSLITKIEMQQNLKKLLQSRNHQERKRAGKSKNLITASRPFWLSRKTWNQVPGKLFLSSRAVKDTKNIFFIICSKIPSWPQTIFFFFFFFYKKQQKKKKKKKKIAFHKLLFNVLPLFLVSKGLSLSWVSVKQSWVNLSLYWEK